MVQSNLTETAWEADSPNTLLEENGHSESYVSEQAMLRLASIAESCRPSDPLLVPMLQQLLPQLRQEDAPLLPARQRRRLFQLMQRSGKPSLFRPANIPLATVLMRVLAVDGERKTLEYILKTATAVPWRPHHFPMQMVARECLPSLRGKHCEDGSFPEGLTSQEEERQIGRAHV